MCKKKKKKILYCSVPGAFADNSSFRTKHLGNGEGFNPLSDLLSTMNGRMWCLLAKRVSEHLLLFVWKFIRPNVGWRGPAQCRKLKKVPNSSEPLTLKMRDSRFERRVTLSLFSGITFLDNLDNDLRIYKRHNRTQENFFCLHDSFTHTPKCGLPRWWATCAVERVIAFLVPLKLGDKMNHHEIRQS